MTTAIISGKAGIVAFHDPAGYRVEYIATGETLTVSAGVLPRLLEWCDDVAHLSYKHEQVARSAARTQWAGDRALMLILLALESDSSEEEILEFGTAAETLLDADPSAVAYAERRLFAHELPHAIPFSRLMELWSEFKAISDLLTRL